MKSKNIIWPMLLIILLTLAAATGIKQLVLQGDMDAGGYNINNAGNIHALFYYGDGSHLTGISGGGGGDLLSNSYTTNTDADIQDLILTFADADGAAHEATNVLSSGAYHPFYVLPVATSSTVGGVAVDGTSVTIDPTTHKISASGGLPFPGNASTNAILPLVTAGVIDASILYESYSTNASFLLAPPINVNTAMENNPVLDVTNSSGTLIIISAPASWHCQGTLNCTNKTIISLYIVPGETNAIFYPKW